jgi:hypothetical protein
METLWVGGKSKYVVGIFVSLMLPRLFLSSQLWPNRSPYNLLLEGRKFDS